MSPTTKNKKVNIIFEILSKALPFLKKDGIISLIGKAEY